jgi:hypothetical protein
MTIPPDLEAQILRYYHVEKWRIGTISRQLRVHPETVARVLAQAGLPRLGPPQRPLKIDPYLPFILEMLGKFPTLTASRLHAMVWERGFDFAAHYRFEPRPVAIARGNEKGRVERTIRYVRDSFFAARTFTDLDDLNAQADAWCRGLAAERRCPEDQARSVGEVFAEEAPMLLRLPDNPYPVVEQVAVKVGKTPYVRFDKNDYSVPHSHVRRTLTVLADADRLRIVEGQQIVATHWRSYDKGKQIEVQAHIQDLVAWKREARRHRATDRLAQAAPASRTLLVRAAERGDNLGSITSALVQLLERYGASPLDAAIIEALDRNVPHPSAVRLALERHRDDRRRDPPVAITLPEHVRARDKAVHPHPLETYDQLTKVRHEEP